VYRCDYSHETSAVVNGGDVKLPAKTREDSGRGAAQSESAGILLQHRRNRIDQA
jgi:hypothetical protein